MKLNELRSRGRNAVCGTRVGGNSRQAAACVHGKSVATVHARTCRRRRWHRRGARTAESAQFSPRSCADQPVHALRDGRPHVMARTSRQSAILLGYSRLFSAILGIFCHRVRSRKCGSRREKALASGNPSENLNLLAPGSAGKAIFPARSWNEWANLVRSARGSGAAVSLVSRHRDRAKGVGASLRFRSNFLSRTTLGFVTNPLSSRVSPHPSPQRGYPPIIPDPCWTRVLSLFVRLATPPTSVGFRLLTQASAPRGLMAVLAENLPHRSRATRVSDGTSLTIKDSIVLLGGDGLEQV